MELYKQQTEPSRDADAKSPALESMVDKIIEIERLLTVEVRKLIKCQLFKNIHGHDFVPLAYASTRARKTTTAESPRGRYFASTARLRTLHATTISRNNK